VQFYKIINRTKPLHIIILKNIFNILFLTYIYIYIYILILRDILFLGVTFCIFVCGTKKI
ncbi:MAG: hypothetical protein N7Q72_04615, partial [Spiroplasma sp. Tabriz.8]|nr:hypothetical protein [Spiroplasma sp. Tabriz.8]